MKAFNKLPPKEQEAILFYAEQLRTRFDGQYRLDKYQHGLGEQGSIELAMALIRFIGKCAL
jgi:hypothetical protein